MDGIIQKARAALLTKDTEQLKTIAEELFNVLLTENNNRDLRQAFADVTLAMPDHLRPTLKELENRSVAFVVRHADALPDKEREEAYREALRQAAPGSELETKAKQKLKELEPMRRSELAAPVPRL